jgi:hypothetical protein
MCAEEVSGDRLLFQPEGCAAIHAPESAREKGVNGHGQWVGQEWELLRISVLPRPAISQHLAMAEVATQASGYP